MFENQSKNLTLPAHDFVREEYSAHLGVFVLSFVNYGLQNMKHRYHRHNLWFGVHITALEKPQFIIDDDR